MADDYFRGVGFCIGREGTKLYVKTLERLGLYTSTQFKNGPDVKEFLNKGVLVNPCAC